MDRATLERIERMGQRSDTREGDRWADVIDCAVLLLPFKSKRKSLERDEIQRTISERCRMKAQTQRICMRIFEASLHPETGEPTLPVRLNWSTARLLVEKGATYDELMEANDASMTLTQARAWAQDRAKVRDEKPLSFWKALVRAVDADIRKTTSPLNDEQQARLLVQVRQAMAEFGRVEA